MKLNREGVSYGSSIAFLLSAGIGPRIYLAPPDEGGGADPGAAGAGGDGAGGAAGTGDGAGGTDGVGGAAGDGAQPSALAGALTPSAEGAAKPAEPAADDGKVEGKDKVKPGEEAPPPADDAPKDVDGNALPEKYEIKMADGVEMDAKLMETAEPLFREHKMSPAQAQAMTDLYSKVQGEQIAKHAEIVNGWLTASKADPEIGGAKFDENLAVAHKAFTTFATPHTLEILDNYGLGNNPEILRFFTRVGKAMGEGATILPGSGTGRVSDAQALYPNMK